MLLHSPGFTSSLLTTLKTSRAQIDAYVETQMEQADVAAASYEARRQHQQQGIDEQVASLLAVQLQRGLHVKEQHSNNNKEESDENEGLAKRREELSQQQEGLKEEIEKLQVKHEEREKHVQGVCVHALGVTDE